MSRKTDNRPLSGWLQTFLHIDKKMANDIIAVAHGSKGTQKIQVKPMLVFLQRVRNLRTHDFKKHRQLARYFKKQVENHDSYTLGFITLLREDLLTALRKSYDVLARAPVPRRLAKRRQRQLRLKRVDALIQQLKSEPLLTPLPPNTDLEDMIAQIADDEDADDVLARTPGRRLNLRALKPAASTTEGYDQDDLDRVVEDEDAARGRVSTLWALEPGAINATTARNNTDFREDADADEDGLMTAKLAKGAAMNATTARNNTDFTEDEDADGLMAAKLAKGNANTFRNPLRL